jgi:hypothetical protein
MYRTAALTAIAVALFISLTNAQVDSAGHNDLQQPDLQSSSSIASRTASSLTRTVQSQTSSAFDVTAHDSDAAASDSPADPPPAAPAVATTTPPKLEGGFVHRLFQAYADDWAGKNDNGPEPARRGWPAPVSSPPYPFADWPMGGTQIIGAPDTAVYPLMQAINGASSRIKVYGWVEPGFNISTSNKSRYANAPAAYFIAPNSVQLDQTALYIERLADEVQTDHFDWGFRIASIYGLDYRFTTANGYFSHQLLGGQNNGAGNWYGFDPVMMYVDLYFPHLAQGTDVRIGRYISLPDIEAQLAPNNYTYSHSLLYTYDCYTQTGINSTTKLSNHWTIQAGLSGGCEASPWSPVAKLTGNLCVAYSWHFNREFRLCSG